MIWYFLLVVAFVVAVIAEHHKEHIIRFFSTSKIPDISIKRSPITMFKDWIAKIKLARHEREQARIKAIQESRARMKEMREQIMKRGRLRRPTTTDLWNTHQEDIRKMYNAAATAKKKPTKPRPPKGRTVKY